jgi:hypothetical protein
MAQRLTPNEKRLFRLCHEALFYLWDPLGVAFAPTARDEYDAYVWKVFELVKADRRSDLIDYLHEVVTDLMGVRADKERDAKVVAFLFDGRDWMDEMSGARLT